MASRCVAEPLEQEAQPQQVPANPQPAVQDPRLVDYDFVEQPSQDFFCPVTLELLIEPHLTFCCGNHLSQEAANRLQRDGKPCPMCKQPQLNTVANKHFKRKVNEIKVRCPHKKSGCEWVGGVNEVKLHSDSCPKRPWQCQYCEFASTYDIGPNEHTPKCTKYPVVCPNSCEIVSLHRCDLEAHLMVCPLQPVVCEYAEVGCNVKVPRRDLARHMEESQQQHLLSATLLNLRLTQKTEQNLLQKIDELKRDSGAKMEELKQDLLQKLDKLERDNIAKVNDLAKKLKELKKDLAAKDQKLDKVERDNVAKIKKLNEVKNDLAAKDTKIADLQSQIERFHKETQKHFDNLHLVQTYSVHLFTLTKFKECQAQGGDGSWFSEWVNSNGGYTIRLDVETNGGGAARGKYMSIRVWVDHDNRGSAFPATFSVHIQLLNQLGDHDHHEREVSQTYPGYGWIRLFPEFIKLTDLEHNVVHKTQYLKDNCLKFRVYFKHIY